MNTIPNRVFESYKLRGFKAKCSALFASKKYAQDTTGLSVDVQHVLILMHGPTPMDSGFYNGLGIPGLGCKNSLKILDEFLDLKK